MMSESSASASGLFDRAPSAPRFANRHAVDAQRILHAGYVVLPVIAGIDKYAEVLTNWNQYLAPVVTRLLPLSDHAILLVIGAVEILAGLLVAFRPSIGGYVVALWLWGNVINLLLVSGFYDVALRDFGLSLGALALARLSQGQGG